MNNISSPIKKKKQRKQESQKIKYITVKKEMMKQKDIELSCPDFEVIYQHEKDYPLDITKGSIKVFVLLQLYKKAKDFF